jgi:outer membrane protein
MWSKIQRLVFPMKGSIGMRLFAVVPALSVLLTAAPTYAQAPTGAAPRPAPAAGQNAPAPRPPAQTPPAAKQPDPPPAAALPPPAAAAPIPFREGGKFGWVNVQAVASQSAEGKNAATKINALRDQRQKELTDKQKALTGLQQKMETEGALRNDTARAAMQADIEKQQRELQRLAEDAEQDIERLTQQLQQEFLAKLQPAIARVAKERSLDFIFSTEGGLVHAAMDLNLTEDVIKAVDSISGGSKPAAAAPAGAKPAGATPPPSPPPAGAPK